MIGTAGFPAALAVLAIEDHGLHPGDGEFLVTSMAVSCGLAQGPDRPATVPPFILRAVNLVGANSVDATFELRQRAWKVLGHTVVDVTD